PETQKILAHWRKLGQFRKNHPAIGAGIHKQMSALPYVFSRGYANGDYTDRVVIGLDLPVGRKEVTVRHIFMDGVRLKDAYSGKMIYVKDGKAIIDSPYSTVLLELNR